MQTWRKHLIVIGAYTLIAVGMTYPLGGNFATAIPGVEGDAGSFVWALGWMKTALERGINPFRSDYVFFPLGGATQTMWAVSLIAALSIPLQAVVGLIAAHNLLYLAATVLTAYGMFLLADYVLRDAPFKLPPANRDARPLPPFQTLLVVQYVVEARRRAALRSPLAPFVAGVVFAFAPLRLGYGLAFFNLFNTQLIPFYALALLRLRRAPTWRTAILAGVFLGLNAYIDFQIAAFLILFTALFAGYALVAERWARVPRLIARLGVAGLIALGIVAPMLGILADDFAREGGNYIRVFPLKYSADRSYDLLAFFVPNARSTAYANVPLQIAGINAPTKPSDVNALSPDRQVFFGYLTLALAAHAVFWKFRRAFFWALTALVFALFALGPTLHIAGADVNVPLPFLLLHEIPIVNHIRIPMRYGIVVVFALAVLAAIGVEDLRARIQKSKIENQNSKSLFSLFVLGGGLWLCPILILIESAVLPYPLQPVPLPRAYEQIARVPGDFTVLEIPTFNWRFAAATEMYQAIHGKRILRAYTNRIAPGAAEYFGTRGTPIVVRSLRMLEGAEKGVLTPDEIAQDRRARDEVVRFYDLRYAVVHRAFLKPAEADALETYVRDVLNARVLLDEGETITYEIPRPPAEAFETRIDLRELTGQMYAGRGWQFEYPQANWDGKFNFVWARGAQAEIYFRADTVADRALTLSARAETPLRVGVALNGERIGEIALTDVWQDQRVELPARALKPGMNRVALLFGTESDELVGVTTLRIEKSK